MSKLPPAKPDLGEELEILAHAEKDTLSVTRKLAAITKLASTRPQELLPYVEDIAKLLDSASAVARTGSLETLALLSRASPGTMAFLLPKLHTLLMEDPQNAVADRAIEILTNYAKTGKRAAEKVIPIFASTIDRIGVRNAKRALDAMGALVVQIPTLGKATLRIAQTCEKSLSRTVRDAAQRLRAALP